MRSVVISLFVVTAFGPAGDTPRNEYEAVAREFDSATKSWIEANSKAATDDERVKASLMRPQPHEFALRLFVLAEKHPQDPVALDALDWIVSKCIFGPQAEKALAMIARDHGKSERLKDFCGQCGRYGEPFPAYENMLRAILKGNPHPGVKGAATLALADYLKMAKEKTESRELTVALGGGLPLSGLQTKNMQAMKERGLDAVAAESAALFQEVIDHYADLRIESNYPQNAGDLAKGQLFVLRNLSIGKKSPEIEGKDIRGKEMKLSDYRGKVIVVDFGSHRSCGVCRQMYPYLRAMVEKFKGKPVALLGVSVEDDVKELVALAEKGETTWPIWWDGENLQGPLAARWAIRAMPTFYVLDPKGVIRNKGLLQPGEIEATVDMLVKEMGDEKP
jgi:peroxiredoxin